MKTKQFDYRIEIITLNSGHISYKPQRKSTDLGFSPISEFIFRLVTRNRYGWDDFLNEPNVLNADHYPLTFVDIDEAINVITNDKKRMESLRQLDVKKRVYLKVLPL
jgi:hypothetical protein